MSEYRKPRVACDPFCQYIRSKSSWNPDGLSGYAAKVIYRRRHFRQEKVADFLRISDKI